MLPITMECIECNGNAQGCQHCKYGEIEITDCPLKMIDMETNQFLTYADMFIEHGTLPVAGGALDQTVSFVQAALFVSREIQSYKRELGIF